jgi:hypothetical protein
MPMTNRLSLAVIELMEGGTPVAPAVVKACSLSTEFCVTWVPVGVISVQTIWFYQLVPIGYECLLGWVSVSIQRGARCERLRT